MPRSEIQLTDSQYQTIRCAAGNCGILCTEPSFLRVLARAHRLASSDVAILLQGETGTGKGCVARAIHQWSGRHDKPFITLHCGDLTPSLAESELFGRTAGAYTGASSAHDGIIMTAHMGTLFIDEINSLPFDVQVKLLRFTDEQEIRPVGSPRSFKVNIRIISATHIDLCKVPRTVFRPDLYYRIGKGRVLLPPLRERPDDILPLAMHALAILRTKGETQCISISQQCRELLLSYPWNGNVRELFNVVEDAARCAEGEHLCAEHLDLPVEEESSGLPTLHEAREKCLVGCDRQYLRQVLSVCNGSIQHAAKTAGVSARTIQRMLKRHGIDTKRFRPAPAK